MKLLATTMLLALVSTTSFAAMNQHSHKQGELEIEAKGKKIEIEMEAPSHAILGFEHLPSTQAEKDKYEAERMKWQNSAMSTLFVINNDLGCTVSESKFIQDLEDSKSHNAKDIHSKIEAKLDLICLKEVKGSDIVVSLKEHYPALDNIKIKFKATQKHSMNSTKPTETFRF